MATLKNVGGQHVFADGTTIAPGAVFEYDGDADELVKKFIGKFEYERTAPVAAPAPTTPAAPSAPTKPEKTADDGFVDMTDDFPVAAQHDLKVLRDRRGWWLYDGDKDPVNEKPLKKKDVDAEIAEYIQD